MSLMRAMRAVLAAIVLGYGTAAAAQEIALDSGWQFQRLGDGSAATQVTLPHTTRIEPRVVNDQWQGVSVYSKSLAVPSSWSGKTVLLRIEAAMNVATVSLNGRPVATHLGGYLPFTIDLTKRLRFGAENRLVVELDNRDNRITGPKPLKDLDFNTYGGLYRGVRLIVKSAVHLSDEMLEDHARAHRVPHALTDDAVEDLHDPGVYRLLGLACRATASTPRRFRTRRSRGRGRRRCCVATGSSSSWR